MIKPTKMLSNGCLPTLESVMPNNNQQEGLDTANLSQDIYQSVNLKIWILLYPDSNPESLRI